MKTEAEPIGRRVSYVAQLLGQHRITILNRVKRGDIPSFDAGGITLVPTWWINEQISKAAGGQK